MKKCAKILYPVAAVSFGGVETFIRHTALFHDPTHVSPFYFFFRNGPLVEWIRAHTSHPVLVADFPIRLRNPISVFRAILWLRGEIRRSGIDLVHSSMAYAALFGAPAAWLARTPHIWFQHGPVGGWMDRLAGILPSRAILYNSEYTRERQTAAEKGFLLRRWISSKPEEIVLPLGAQAAKITQEKHANPDKIRIGMLSRFQKWKGIDLFIAAIAQIRSLLPPETLEVTLWGDAISGQADPTYGDTITEACRQNGIRCEPPTSDPESAMRSLDILVNASITPEPFGLTLVEAMNAGAVPIAPRRGGPLEIIDEGETGLFFEPGNAGDLAAKILELIRDPERRARLAQRSLTVGRDRFSAEKVIEKLETIYARILDPRVEEPPCRS